MPHTALRVLTTLAVVASAGLPAVRAYDFNEQHLVAACTPDQPANGKIRSITATTGNGVGVQHRGTLTGDAVLYCQIDADEQNYFNWMQVVAEDNTSSGSVTATLYRQDILSPGPPVAMHSVTTSNVAGVQIASDAGLDDTLDEYQYVYWIEVRLNRSSSAATVTVYSVALMDVL